MTWPGPPRPDVGAPARPTSAGAWAGILVAAGVVIGIMVSAITALSWYHHDVEALAKERQAEVDGLLVGVHDRLAEIGDFVVAQSAGFKGATLPSQEEMNAQFALPDVLSRQPGVIGEFYVERVDDADLAAFVARQQAEVSPSFVVLPTGPRAEYWVVARGAELAPVDGRPRRAIGDGHRAGARPVA